MTRGSSSCMRRGVCGGGGLGVGGPRGGVARGMGGLRLHLGQAVPGMGHRLGRGLELLLVRDLDLLLDRGLEVRLGVLRLLLRRRLLSSRSRDRPRISRIRTDYIFVG
jgi:hypothetical protein